MLSALAHRSSLFEQPRSARAVARTIAIALGALAGAAHAQVMLGSATPLAGASTATLDRAGVTLATAANGVSLAVWCDNRSGEYDVYGSLIAPDGTRITPLGGFPIFPTPGIYEGEANVAACGNTFLVVFGRVEHQATISSVEDLYAARIDTSGNLLDAAAIAIAASSAYLERNVRGISSDGVDMFLVPFHSNENFPYGDIKVLHILASSGAVIGTPGGLNVSNEASNTLRKNPSSSFGAGKFLVTWDDGRDGCRYANEQGCVDIYGAFVEVDPFALAGGAFATTSAYSCQEASASSFDGTNFVVAHSDERLNNCFTADLVAERVDTSAVVLDPITDCPVLNGEAKCGGIYIASDPSGFPDSVQSVGSVVADRYATLLPYRDFGVAAPDIAFRLRRLNTAGKLEFGEHAGIRGPAVAIGPLSVNADPRVHGQAIGPHEYLLAYALGDVPYVRVAQYTTPFKLGFARQGLARPRGVAVDAQGRVIVANTGMNRIDVFNSSGVLQFTFGAGGIGNGQFREPFGVAVDAQGDIYVADSLNHRVQVFTAQGLFKFKFGSVGVGNGQFRSPLGIAVGADGKIVVADTDNHRVQVFSASGVFLFKFGSKGSLPGQFSAARAVTLDASGRFYVADRDNHRVQVFAANGVLNAVISAGLSFPRGVALDGDGKLFVADSQNNRVVVFTPSGQFHYSFGSTGTNLGQFKFPTALAVDASGNSYVVDTNNQRVQFFGGVP